MKTRTTAVSHRGGGNDGQIDAPWTSRTFSCLREALKEAFDRHSEEIRKSCLPAVRAEIVSLASDGIMFRELLGVVSYSPEQRRRITDMLLKMVDELEETK